MSTHTINIAMLIYLLVLIFFAEKIYFITLSVLAKRRLKKLGYELSELEFSFEQISYLVATPSSNCDFCNLSIDRYKVEKAKACPFNPASFALKIYAKMPDGEDKLLAILDKERFPVPILDTLLYYKKINQRDYDILISYLFSHYNTHQLIVQEVRERLIER
ncbi:hypothetical protein [Halonatronum saccharophilum]|uniref:hypothetical protein n=1 Tax=Halonatronum saccharophilum TaxID=150060 RepID=UPI000481C860|nr:hypothetical protein [Halonatronum saccharophilum]